MRAPLVLCLMVVVLPVSALVDHRHEDSLRETAHSLLASSSDPDPLILMETDPSSGNIYQSVQIVEKSNEDVNGYTPPTSPDDYYALIALAKPQNLLQPKDKSLKPLQPVRSSKQQSASEGTESSSSSSSSKPSRPRFKKRNVEPQQPSSYNLPDYNYEDRWSWVEDYHKNHSKISADRLEKRHALLREIASRYQTNREEDQYVVYTPTKAGLGNTMAAMSEALLLAIYTKRNFGICQWNTILQFYTFPYRHPIVHKTTYTRSSSTIISQYGKNCNLDFESLLNRTDSHQYIVMNTGTCGLLNYFVHSTFLSQWMQEHGIIPSGKTTHLMRMHCLLQFLYVDVMIPNPSVWDQVQAFRNQVQWDSLQVIGIHVRTGMLDGNVPWGRFLEREDIPLFFREAERHSAKLKRANPAKPVKWLVMVDNKEIRNEFKEKAGEYYLSSERTVLHSKDGEIKGIENSIVDSYLLSECKVMILTMKSTYGYLSKHRGEAIHNSISPGLHKKANKKG